MNFNSKIDTVITMIGKGAILLLNFAIVVITTQLWGAEGRGSIAIFVADLGLIGIFANIFTGSSVSFYIQKVSESKLATQAYLWTFLVSLVGGIIQFVTGGWKIAIFFFLIACFSGTIAFFNALFVGKQHIKHYNLITILQPAFILIFTLIIHKINAEISYFAYFFAYLISTLLVFLIASLLTRKKYKLFRFFLDKKDVFNSFNFGWKTELSNFLQFFNYRLTYYVLGFYIGNASVGIFSIGVTISEAIWIVSRSISLVQYSQVLKEGNNQNSRKETQKAAFYSLLGTIVCIGLVLLLPAKVYAFVFGEEFANIKSIIWMLSPGIIAIAVSNVYGNFFSAVGNLNILIIKSLAGLIVTVIMAFTLIPILDIRGACIVNVTSYILSSCILILYFIIHEKDKQRERTE